MQFPYGIFDFKSIMEEKMFYVDRTSLIPDIEYAGRQLIFLRPRRFGKSLLLSMLENYYDIAKADNFEALFGKLAIGSQPTKLHNRYIVMKWDFSLVASHGDVQDIELRLHQHINQRIKMTVAKYRNFIQGHVDIIEGNAIASFESLVGVIENSGYKLYLMIDEYDNFTT